MSEFKKWFNSMLGDVNYLGMNLSKEAWDYQQQKITTLEEELEQQKFNNKHNIFIDQKIVDRITELEEENKAFREALGFYGDKKSWIDGALWGCEPTILNIDRENFEGGDLLLGGKRAREVLNKYPEGENVNEIRRK